MLYRAIRKTVDEMIDIANELNAIEIQSTLKKKRKWYGKTEEVVYRLINGDIKSESFYPNSKIIYYYKGASVQWHPSSPRPLGNREQPYLSVSYYKNGNFENINEGYYLDNVESRWWHSGTDIFFFENGKVSFDIFYSPAGCLTGYYMAYHPNGKIAVSGQYTNKAQLGVEYPDGQWIWYFEDGSIGKEINFINGFCVGNLILYNKDGSVNVSKTYTEKDKVFVADILEYYWTAGPFVIKLDEKN